MGRFGGQPTITDYIDQVAADHARELVSWRSVDGLKLCLLLGSHPTVGKVLASLEIDGKSLSETLRWATVGGDSISRTTIFETALERAASDPAVADAVGELIDVYLMEGTGCNCDQFEILSAVFLAVYGELGQIRILATMPPYWRRLAALAHAALIVRCLIRARVELSDVVQWFAGVRAQPYFLHCYADLRLEPRWLPEYAMGNQLKNELVGRIIGHAYNLRSVVEALNLDVQLLEDAVPSLKSQIELMRIVLSGPLEGNVQPTLEISNEDYLVVRHALEMATPTASSFLPLVSVVLWLRIPMELSELAAEALSRAQFQIEAGGDLQILGSTLAGLAITAAVTRCQALADAVFSTLRIYRRFFPDEVSVSTAFLVGIIACANRDDVEGWAANVGSLISDLAFGDLSIGEAIATRTLVIQLCDLVPELWSSCGQGLAALEAIAASG